MSEQLTDTVLLIHGTFAGSNEDAGPRWWQKSSHFWNWLNEALKGRARCEEVFHWSGQNREHDRLAAGSKLYHRLMALEDQGRRYHLVGHSHGGSVIWAALKQAAAHGKMLDGLRSWTTVGTPYFSYRLRMGDLLFLVPLLLAALVGLAQAVQGGMTRRYAADLWSAGYRWTFAGLIVLWLVTALCLAYCAFRVVGFAWAAFALWRDRRRAAAAYSTFSPRWQGLWSSEDEAINGLRSTLNLGDLQYRGKPLRVLPRYPVPIFSNLGDRLFFEWLKRFLQGNDLLSRRLADVTPAPRIEGDLVAPPLTGPDHDDLIQRVAEGVKLPGTLNRLRRILGQLAFGGPLQSFWEAEDGETSPAFAALLVHTLYLPERTETDRRATVPERIARFIGERAGSGPVPAPVSPQGMRWVPPAAPGGPWRRFLAATAVQRTLCYGLLGLVLISWLGSNAMFDRVRQFTPESLVRQAIDTAPETDAAEDPAANSALAGWALALYEAAARGSELRSTWGDPLPAVHGLTVAAVQVQPDRAGEAISKIEDPLRRAEALAEIAEELAGAGPPRRALTLRVAELARGSAEQARPSDPAGFAEILMRLARLHQRVRDASQAGELAYEAGQVAQTRIDAIKQGVLFPDAGPPANAPAPDGSGPPPVENRPDDRLPAAPVTEIGPVPANAPAPPEAPDGDPVSPPWPLPAPCSPGPVADPRSEPNPAPAPGPPAADRPSSSRLPGPSNVPALDLSPLPAAGRGTENGAPLNIQVLIDPDPTQAAPPPARDAGPEGAPAKVADSPDMPATPDGARYVTEPPPRLPRGVIVGGGVNLTPTDAPRMVNTAIDAATLLNKLDRGDDARALTVKLLQSLSQIRQTAEVKGAIAPQPGGLSLLSLDVVTQARLAVLVATHKLESVYPEGRKAVLQTFDQTWSFVYESPLGPEEADAWVADLLRLKLGGELARWASEVVKPARGGPDNAAQPEILVLMARIQYAAGLAESSRTAAAALATLPLIRPHPYEIDELLRVSQVTYHDYLQGRVDRHALRRVRLRLELADIGLTTDEIDPLSPKRLLEAAWDDAFAIVLHAPSQPDRADRASTLAEVIHAAVNLEGRPGAVAIHESIVERYKKAIAEIPDLPEEEHRSPELGRALRRLSAVLGREGRMDAAEALAESIVRDADRLAARLYVANRLAMGSARERSHARQIVEEIQPTIPDRAERRRERSPLLAGCSVVWSWLGEPQRAVKARENCLAVDRLRADTVLLHLFGLPEGARPLEELPEPAAPSKAPPVAPPPPPPISLPQAPAVAPQPAPEPPPAP
jgi:hypothetical protein